MLKQVVQCDAAARLLVERFTPPRPREPHGAHNVAWTPSARRSARFYFITEDAASDRDLNRVIWKAVRGENTLIPAPRRRAFRKLETRQKKDGDD